MDPLGTLLRQRGALDDDGLADVLRHGGRALPTASLCYVLGYADEEVLVRALSAQAGAPGIVLDRSVIPLSGLADAPREFWLESELLPFYEDDSRVLVATPDPGRAGGALAELERYKGRAPLPHVALYIALARVLRACLEAAARGEDYYVGVAAPAQATPAPCVVSEEAAPEEGGGEARAEEVVIGEVTKELYEDDLIAIESDPSTTRETTLVRGDRESEAGEAAAGERSTEPSLQAVTPGSWDLELAASESELGRGARGGAGEEDAPASGDATDRDARRPRVLVVDDDIASTNLVAKALQPAGFAIETTASGTDAVRRLREDPPALVIADMMLPEVDGLEICRGIKSGDRYGSLPVILVSAVLETGHVTPAILERYGVDAYFEKPLDVGALTHRARELVIASAERPRSERARAGEGDDSFQQAMAHYRDGRIDDAIAAVKRGIERDPLSPVHHFALANLFQKRARTSEAIDAYEATIELRPDYFPALTRLAYLYYRNGYTARAVEAWRRALPHCPDPALRENIEIFMRKLIADMDRAS